MEDAFMGLQRVFRNWLNNFLRAKSGPDVE